MKKRATKKRNDDGYTPIEWAVGVVVFLIVLLVLLRILGFAVR